ncbi:linearmycin resistance permease LnrM [Terrabacter koreensis]
MRPVLAIVTAELRRFLRDRSNLFFVFIFPLVLVLVIGAQFGSGATAGKVAVAGESGAMVAALTTQLESEGLVVTSGSREDVLEQVSRGRAAVAVLVPDGAGAAFAAGRPVTLEVVPGSASNALAVQQRVRGAVDVLQLDQAQLAALTGRGVAAPAARAAVDAARAQVTGPSTRVENVDALAREFQGVGQFDVGAASQLLLFTFLTSLAGSATLIQARRHGVIARTMAAPVSSAQVLLGQAGGRLVIALAQGIYIVVATSVLFGVDWGSLWLTGLVLLVFGAVSAGLAMVLGSLVDNEGAAGGLGVGLGLVLAGLGGGMVPLEVFSDTLRGVAHVTPHAWAYEAFAEIQRRDGTLVDVLPQLGVLTAMAVAALAVGAWALRRSLARAM